MKRLIILCVLFMLGGLSSAQVSGYWEGEFGGMMPQNLAVEFYIYQDTLVSGISHLEQETNIYEHYILDGKYDPEQKLVYFSENFLTNAYVTHLENMCMGNYSLFYFDTLNRQYMKGVWMFNENGAQECMNATITLSKKDELKNSPALIDHGGKRVDFQAFCEIAQSSKSPVQLRFYRSGNETATPISIQIAGQEEKHLLDRTHNEVLLEFPGRRMEGLKKILLEADAESGENLVNVDVIQGKNTATFLLAPSRDRISVLEMYFSYGSLKKLYNVRKERKKLIQIGTSTRIITGSSPSMPSRINTNTNRY